MNSTHIFASAKMDLAEDMSLYALLNPDIKQKILTLREALGNLGVDLMGFTFKGQHYGDFEEACRSMTPRDLVKNMGELEEPMSHPMIMVCAAGFYLTARVIEGMPSERFNSPLMPFSVLSESVHYAGLAEESPLRPAKEPQQEAAS